jgi:hypothetical protein
LKHLQNFETMLHGFADLGLVPFGQNCCRSVPAAAIESERVIKVKGKNGKHGKDGCDGRPGKPGPVAETIVFGAQSLGDGDAGLLKFFLVASGNMIDSPPLDASALSNLTAGYAYVATSSTNKLNLSVSIDGDNTPATVNVIVTVASPTLPVTAAFPITRAATKPFAFIPNVDLNVSAGYILLITIDPGSLPAAAVTGVNVVVERYIG